MQVTFNGQVYECDAALRGGDYVQLFTDGEPTVSLYGVVDFEAFQLSGGEWSYPYVVLEKEGWVGDSEPYTQTVEVAGVTSTNDLIIAPRTEGGVTKAELDVFDDCYVRATHQGLGTLTFTAYDGKPDMDLKVNVRPLV